MASFVKRKPIKIVFFHSNLPPPPLQLIFPVAKIVHRAGCKSSPANCIFPRQMFSPENVLLRCLQRFSSHFGHTSWREIVCPLSSICRMNPMLQCTVCTLIYCNDTGIFTWRKWVQCLIAHLAALSRGWTLSSRMSVSNFFAKALKNWAVTQASP